MIRLRNYCLSESESFQWNVELGMDEDIALLVADALDVVNPEDDLTAAVARRLAADIREQLKPRFKYTEEKA